jgi:hypothetical protein
MAVMELFDFGRIQALLTKEWIFLACGFGASVGYFSVVMNWTAQVNMSNKGVFKHELIYSLK